MKSVLKVIALVLVMAMLISPVAIAATYLPPYQVQGDSLSELKTYMEQNGPQDNSGTHYPAITYIDVVPNKQQTSSTKPVDEPYYECTVTVTVTWTVTALIKMPEWPGSGDACQAVQDEWNRYLEALEDHEEGHEQVANDALNNMQPSPNMTFTATGRGLSPGEAELDANNNLGDIDAQIEAKRQEILAEIDKKSKEYDETTGHGATQGATLNTGIGCGTPEERIEGLTGDVEFSDASEGVANSLNAKLEAALKALQKGNNGAAANQLNAFINQVNAVSGTENGPTEQEGQGLVSQAQSIQGQIPGGQ